MAPKELSPAKAVLLAVQAATKADIATLRTLIATCPGTLNPIILRILLTFLPESIESSAYVQLLIDFVSGNIKKDDDSSIDESPLNGISEAEAAKKVRKLRLLPLRMQDACTDAPEDALTLFLLHRAYRVDEETGLITQLPNLIAPFLGGSEYLRGWMLGTLVPLLRLNYEYHPSTDGTQSLKWFEELDTANALRFLLSRTVSSEASDDWNKQSIVRDIKGLAGPWLYGNNHYKRRRVTSGRRASQTAAEILNQRSTSESPYGDWDAMFSWISQQASVSSTAIAELVASWMNVHDVDLGGYGDPEALLTPDDSEALGGHYDHCALTSAYRIPESSLPTLTDAHRILSVISRRLNDEPIPTLQAAAAMLLPVQEFADESKSVKEQIRDLIIKLRNEDNTYSAPPNPELLNFFQALLTSTYLLLRSATEPPSIEETAHLLLKPDSRRQHDLLDDYLTNTAIAAAGDDKIWLRRRNEILWLHDWGLPLVDEEGTYQTGRGPLGQIPRAFVHTAILQSLIANTRFALARQIYEEAEDRPLDKDVLSTTILKVAMDTFQKANNPNKTQGGIKQSLDILNAFPLTFAESVPGARLGHLAEAMHVMRSYRLILDNNEPWKPSVLLTHGDPLAIVEKVLAQNTRRYPKLDEFLYFGEQVVKAGLTVRDKKGAVTLDDDAQLQEQLDIAKWRITAMCIDAALSEDDFETAYSYVVNRLPSMAGEAYIRPSPAEERDQPPSQTPTPMSEHPQSPMFEVLPSGVMATPPPKTLDSWSWPAAFRTGKYQLNAYTLKPSHVGNSSANPQIRHLEQRMECLGQALLLAPPSALQEILNVFRRCEEEWDVRIREEAEQEEKWDERAEEVVLPGTWGEEQPISMAREGAATSQAKGRVGEGPMSLFDLTRASAERAQKSLKALNIGVPVGLGRGENASGRGSDARMSMDSQGSGHSGQGGVSGNTVRKRDQLRSAAVGTLAGGIGWLIGAPVPPQNRDQHSDER